MTTASKPSAKSFSVLIVLGFDDQNPRGARFVGADPDLVRKAAEAMDLQVYEVAPSSDLAAAVKALPVGKVHGKGTGFVPVIEQDLYSEVLVALATKIRDIDDQADPPVAQGLPGTFDEIAPGHLVLAQETLEYGWWETRSPFWTPRAEYEYRPALTLQLLFCFEVRSLSERLVSSTPE